jgi:hypothetical protein
VIFPWKLKLPIFRSHSEWDSAMSMLAMSVMCKHVDVIQPTSNSPSLDKLNDLHESHHIPQPLYVCHPGFSYWNWIYSYRGGGAKKNWVAFECIQLFLGWISFIPLTSQFNFIYLNYIIRP